MIASPPICRGMTVLDRSKFKTTVPLMMAKVEPRLIGTLGKDCPDDLLEARGISRVVKTTSDDSSNLKGVLLRKGVTSLSELSEKAQQLLGNSELCPYDLELDYNYWTADDILQSVLPEDLAKDAPSGFTIVGHIAHMNLRDEFLPYKSLIGEIIMDKNSGIQLVVNKLDKIHTVYRTFDMEVIAGDQSDESVFMVEQHESNCRFVFDFRKVYWNSRLHSEHERIISKFQPGEAVCDPFAGVGPFAVPAGKKEVLVFASDLNPSSAESMRGNIVRNKVEQFVNAFNIDAREFIRDSTQRLLKYQAKTPQMVLSPPRPKSRSSKAPKPEPRVLETPKFFSHFVMNLPDSAIEFLDAFRGLYASLDVSERPEVLPMIHVHCFYKHLPTEKEPPLEKVYADLAVRCSKPLGFDIQPKDMHFHDVRKVAPTKEMYCISFRLPEEVAYATSD